jgi:hypothetical protein
MAEEPIQEIVPDIEGHKGRNRTRGNEDRVWSKRQARTKGACGGGGMRSLAADREQNHKYKPHPKSFLRHEIFPLQSAANTPARVRAILVPQMQYLDTLSPNI